MEKKSLTPYVVVVALMLATSLALAFTVNVNITDEAGVSLDLPDQVGDWTGKEILFCRNAECQKAFTVDQLKDRAVCPDCGGMMSSMSYIEALQLPDDTLMVKKQYEDPAGRQIVAAIVLSGKERASIHRPQVCLTGQGREITTSLTLPVPIEGREPLRVMLLELYKQWPLPGGRVRDENMYYAYWFVGKNRETPYHTMRMVYMAADRVFFNVAHRWAYISVTGLREAQGEAHRELVTKFISELYPHIRTAGP